MTLIRWHQKYYFIVTKQSIFFYFFRVDYDATAFSPPSDDNFFYIRYPVSNNKNDLGINGTITEAINSSSIQSVDDKKLVDLTKHTISCKQYIHGSDGELFFLMFFW